MASASASRVRSASSTWTCGASRSISPRTARSSCGGEAGAIDLLGSPLGLPRAYSGHNGFSEWGIPPARDTHALIVGFDGPADARPQFQGCRALARINDGIGLENDEQGYPVMLCRVAGRWPALWPQLTHYD